MPWWQNGGGPPYPEQDVRHPPPITGNRTPTTPTSRSLDPDGSADVVQNLTMILPSAVTPGMDLTPIKNIGNELSAGRASAGANR